MRGKIRTRWPSPGRPKPSNFTGVKRKTGPPPLRGSPGYAPDEKRSRELSRQVCRRLPFWRLGPCCDTRLA
jgi:hypothetical protein